LPGGISSSLFKRTSKLFTGISLALMPKASPFARASPTLIPVNDPGPVVTAIASMLLKLSDNRSRQFISLSGFLPAAELFS
jgi:hypothetical protein